LNSWRPEGNMNGIELVILSLDKSVGTVIKETIEESCFL